MNILLIESLTFGLSHLVKSAEEIGIKLHLLTQDKSRYFYELSQMKSDYLIVNIIDTFDTLLIVDYVNEHHISNIINLTDTWCFISQEVKKKLGLSSSNDQSIYLARNKDQLRKKLLECQLTSGTYTVLNLKDKSVIDSFEYPVIIKDIQGTGSKNVWFANNKKDFNSLIEYLKNSVNVPHLLLIETYFS